VTTESKVSRSAAWWKYWPAFVGGFCGPLLSAVLARRLPFHFAVGLAFFTVWFLVGLIFVRRSPPKWGLPGWFGALLAGLGAGICGGVLSYFFPWR
jgi:hypothetical protein